MSRCLIDGHRPIQRDGVGDYAGKQYLVCSECATTLGEVSTLHELADASVNDIDGRPVAGIYNGRTGELIARYDDREALLARGIVMVGSCPE